MIIYDKNFNSYYLNLGLIVISAVELRSKYRDDIIIEENTLLKVEEIFDSRLGGLRLKFEHKRGYYSISNFLAATPKEQKKYLFSQLKLELSENEVLM